MKKQLVHLLIVKSILDIVLVSTIAVVVYARAFPPTFHGWGEAVAESRSISGWAVNSAAPRQHVAVQLFVDGEFVGTQVAYLSRPDVLAAGWSRDEWHGYGFVVSALNAGTHEARIYALHGSGNGSRYTLQLLGDPIVFDVSADGSWQVSPAKAQRRKGESRHQVFALHLCALAGKLLLD